VHALSEAGAAAVAMPYAIVSVNLQSWHGAMKGRKAASLWCCQLCVCGVPGPETLVCTTRLLAQSSQSDNKCSCVEV
jgi:hypothetical protein